MKPLLIATGLVALLLTGCAGYNHTLFMTKSNAGLDFDSKPPTLEVTVSRKESVVAPSFEGGKTPPVMASFKPHTGTGSGFKDFFLGVDQTFAGGDAAMAMSMLYDKPTATDPKPYEEAATLPLTEKPPYSDWFRKLPGQGATRPFIFGTDTSLGLKAGWSGVGGQVPDTIKLGFNRKEFAWAPLNATQALDSNGTADCKKVNVRMPAFLATIDSNQKIDANGSTRVEALQYFATGKAATHLAMQQDVRRAMHARFDPNQQAYKAKFMLQGGDIIPAVLFSMQAVLDRYEQRKDARATELRDKLNNLSNVDLPDAYGNDEVPIYVFDQTPGGNPDLKKNEGQPVSFRPTTRLRDAIGYLAALEASQSNLAMALDAVSKENTVELHVWTPELKTSTIDGATALKLHADLDKLQERSRTLIEQLASNEDMRAAYEFVQRKLNP